jgi:hypothetical protein
MGYWMPNGGRRPSLSVVLARICDNFHNPENVKALSKKFYNEALKPWKISDKLKFQRQFLKTCSLYELAKLRDLDSGKRAALLTTVEKRLLCSTLRMHSGHPGWFKVQLTFQVDWMKNKMSSWSICAGNASAATMPTTIV